VLVFLGALAWLQWGRCYRGHCRDYDDDHQPPLITNLVLHDSQRLVLSSVEVIPEPGDEDIILIVVQNVDDHDVVNITVTMEVVSAARKRSPLSLSVICPPFYVDNVVPYLATQASTTCRAVYYLTAGDIVNGNVIYTQSMATGTLLDTDLTTMAEPGMSQLSINNVEIHEGAIISIPGPAGPAGPVNVVSAPCAPNPPYTSLLCTSANQLQLLFCDYASNKTQLGNIYMCVNGAWLFYGHVGNNSAAGPPGISVYAATCSGGPPPTSITEPVYTCNEAFNLNMVLCDLPSLDSNVGIIYECLCKPTCGWVQVANLNIPLVFYTSYETNPGPFNNSHMVWNQIITLPILTVGRYTCIFEGTVHCLKVGSACPMYYGISSVPFSDAWIQGSERSIALASLTGNYVPIATVVTSANVHVTSAPESIYVTAGIETGATGCADYSFESGSVGSTLQCLQGTLLP